MSLQFIIGSSGIGKTHYACEQIIRESMENPQHLYYIIVPEQFTMQTQKNVVEMHPGKGILKYRRAQLSAPCLSYFRGDRRCHGSASG